MARLATILVLALLLSLSMAALGSVPGSQRQGILAAETSGKDVVTRYVEVLNSGNADELDELIAPDVAPEGEEPGLDAFKQRFAEQYAGRNELMAEWRIEVRTIIAEDDTVALYAKLVGKTHDGKPIDVPLMGFFTIRDGKIASMATMTDVAAFIEQAS